MVECEICGKEFKTKRGLDVHKRFKHIKETKLDTKPRVYAVCTRIGGYKKNGLIMPKGKVTELTAKQWESVKSISGMIEVKIGDHIRV